MVPSQYSLRTRRGRENDLAKEQSQETNQTEEAKDFHIHFMYSTAAWLRSKRSKDASTVPAVVRKIVEEAEREDKKKGKG